MSTIVKTNESKKMAYISGVLGICVVGLLIALAATVGKKDDECEVANTAIDLQKPPSGSNICAGKKVDFPNIKCLIDDINEQSGADVSEGYTGLLDTTAVPIPGAYYKFGLCPVNVHWHLGTEHRSAGQYDENGSGPEKPENHDDYRRLAAGEVRKGYQCNYYNEDDEKFTKPYDWKYCHKSMMVGETYEVHWPHSANGACGTPNQYQTPFYDGVFCNGLNSDPLPFQVGVQAQVFTIVNDERYYWPDLFRGMIVDGEMGDDIAVYTGSTTGTTRSNTMCSQYTPITWQVDRKCHLISASSFDKMCKDMLSQRDDMTDDLYAHGSRELVDDEFTANNHQDYEDRS